MGYRIPYTENGYPLPEVVSALQKAIRRGEESAALYWASEMDLSGYGEYAWKRLKLICTEDVGLAAPGLATEIASLYSFWLEVKKAKKYSEGIYIAHAVVLLARAEKHRMMDHIYCLYWEDRATLEKLEVPDEALDSHTPRGKAMGRKGLDGFEHFQQEAGKLHNRADIPDPYHEPYLNGRRLHYSGALMGSEGIQGDIMAQLAEADQQLASSAE